MQDLQTTRAQEAEPDGARGSNAQSGGARSDADYAKALGTVLDIADFALSFVPGGSAASGAVKIVAKAAPAAKAAVSGAKRAMEENPELAGKTVGAVSMAAGAVAHAAPEIKERAGGLFSKVRGAVGGAAGSAAAGVAGKVREASAARRESKERDRARKTLLDRAGSTIAAERFLENWSAAADAGEAYLDYSGCYVVVTLDRGIKKEASDYRDVYVGSSESMGEAILKDLVGLGNPDVYADVKYKQDVRVMLFPCRREKIEQLRDSLVVALDADESYNRTRA